MSAVCQWCGVTVQPLYTRHGQGDFVSTSTGGKERSGSPAGAHQVDPGIPTLGDGPHATAVAFHGLDGSATVWVDPIGHVKLSPKLVEALAEGVVSRNTAAAKAVAS